MTTLEVVLGEISRLELVEGARLPSERNLAETCAMSRTSIRNALKDLQSRRILGVKQGSGYYLSSQFALEQALSGIDENWSLARIGQVVEAINFLDPHVLGLCAAKMTAAALAELEACLVDFGRATIGLKAESIATLHTHFYKIIHDCCPNREFVRMLSEVRIPLEYIIQVLERASDEEKNHFFADHVTLFHALKKQDLDKITLQNEHLNLMLLNLFTAYEIFSS